MACTVRLGETYSQPMFDSVVFADGQWNPAYPVSVVSQGAETPGEMTIDSGRAYFSIPKIASHTYMFVTGIDLTNRSTLYIIGAGYGTISYSVTDIALTQYPANGSIQGAVYEKGYAGYSLMGGFANSYVIAGTPSNRLFSTLDNWISAIIDVTSLTGKWNIVLQLFNDQAIRPISIGVSEIRLA